MVSACRRSNQVPSLHSRMSQWCAKHGVEIWAWCLMPNHVHLIAVPPSEDALRRAIGEAHRRYTRRINFRKGWRGHLWQGRFASFVMDQPHLLAAAHYVELNPVRARLVRKSRNWPWSSVTAHLRGLDDSLVKVGPLLELVDKWGNLLEDEVPDAQAQEFRRHERTGRPLGDERFVRKLEKRLARDLRPGKPGPKPSPPGRKRGRR